MTRNNTKYTRVRRLQTRKHVTLKRQYCVWL